MLIEEEVIEFNYKTPRKTISSSQFEEIALKVVSQVITAKRRKLKAVWTMEASQDLMNNLGSYIWKS